MFINYAKNHNWYYVNGTNNFIFLKNFFKDVEFSLHYMDIYYMPPKVFANFCTRNNFLFISLSLKALVDYYSFFCQLRNNEVAHSSLYPVGLYTEKC